jgi:HlyD family secretion protein
MRQFLTRVSRRTKIIVVASAAVVVLLFLIFGRGGRRPASTFQTEKVGRGILTATVGATGTVRARQSAVLIWQTSGTVESVNVKVGDRVSQDEVLASLDKTSVPQNIILAEADLVNAQKALVDLLDSDTARANAQIALKDAQDAYKKAYNYRLELNNKGWFQKVVVKTVNHQLIPQVYWYRGHADSGTIAKAADDLALKKAQLDDSQRAYDRLENGPNKEDVSAAQARVAAAEVTLNMIHIAAPFAGTITQAEPAIGNQVEQGAVGFRIDDLSHLLVDVQVSEVDINSVSLDQEATLSFDAILNKDYHGKVVEVSQAGDAVQGVVNFTVTIELTDADVQVKPGMTAAVNIIITELHDVLLVPNRAVRLINNERVVYILQNDQPVKVKVRLGQSSDSQSVVVGGDIKEGDLVILNPPTEFNGPFGG